MPYSSSSSSLPVSTNECTVSLSMAELPVNTAAPAFVTATGTLPIRAAQTAVFEPPSPPSASAIYLRRSLRARATTLSALKPNSFSSTLAGADAPKWSMPMTSPAWPT